MYSFVITRGSVPIFWEQSAKSKTKLYEDVFLTRSSEMTKEPFRKHFHQMITDYSKVQIIDLLKDKTERETRLTKEYYKQFYDSDFKKDNTLKFLHFDFHRFCKGDKFSDLKLLIGQLSDSIKEYG
jgi:type VI protein secretion system component VasK